MEQGKKHGMFLDRKLQVESTQECNRVTLKMEINNGNFKNLFNTTPANIFEMYVLLPLYSSCFHVAVLAKIRKMEAKKEFYVLDVLYGLLHSLDILQKDLK